MSIIEQATKRLEQLRRAGVAVPWEAAGLTDAELRVRTESHVRTHPQGIAPAQPPSVHVQTHPTSTLRRVDGHVPVGGKTVNLDLEGLERSGQIVSTHSRTALSEEFRKVKRPLLRNARGASAAAERLSMIMVTSALPGEGKTFCAANLAMSMAAEIDTSVILVDADVVRPGVLRHLGLQDEKGLLDILTDSDLDLSSVLLTTNVPKLSILPAGAPSSRSTELLASEAMHKLLSGLADSHPDHVFVFDGPPLLVTTEASVLASRVGQVVLVVEASKTLRRDVAQALAALEHCPLVMLMLNKQRAPLGGQPYGYGYYG